MKDILLARSQVPQPDGSDYFAHDLNDPERAAELFAYAQIELARVTRAGWRHLFRRHGLDGLLAINRRAGRFEAIDDETASAELFEQALWAGYDPVSGMFGQYRGQGAFVPASKD